MPESFPVVLHVYDLSRGMARSLSQQFLGIHINILPHTGLVVHGREFFYSGGIQSLQGASAFATQFGVPLHEAI